MFTINLYKFNKKHNSTEQPTGTGRALTCDMNTNSSIIAPVMVLQTDPTDYNYAYIAEFNRYYFIDNITYAYGVWNVALVCDVLATYKTDIGSASLMVERSASASDGDLIDATRLTKAGFTGSESEIVPAVTGDGYYVVTALSPTGSGLIGYQFTPANFKSFINSLFSLLDGYQPGDILDSILTGVSDPLQYLTGCHWFPYSMPTAGAATAIQVGIYPAQGSAAPVAVGSKIVQNYIAIPRHPRAAAEGNYLNLSPFTRYVVNWQPYGAIELDTTKMISATRIIGVENIDPLTGEGNLRIIASNADDSISAQLASVSAQVGVPIPLSQGSINAGSITQAVAGAASMFTGNPVAGLALMASATSAAIPTVSTLGSLGSMAAVRSAKTLFSWFSSVSDIDNTNQGKPLHSVRTLSTLSGYIQTATGDISADGATLQELETIRNYLTGGFYYE